jgi:hypothetical protein
MKEIDSFEGANIGIEAEYYYQQGLLLLSKNQKKAAVEHLKYYAKVGSNPRQVARASQLAVANSN